MTQGKKYTEYGYVFLGVWGAAFLMLNSYSGVVSMNDMGTYSLFLLMVMIVTGLFAPLIFQNAHKAKETQANIIGTILSVIVIVATVVGILSYVMLLNQ